MWVDKDKQVNAKRRRWWWLGLAVLVVIAGIAFERHAGHSRTGRMHWRKAPQRVGVARAVAGSMPETLSELGTVTPLATVTVLPQLSGYLTKIGFIEGQEVTKGQFLAQIDPRPYQIQLEQYQGQQAKDQALLHEAQSDLARYEVLRRQDSISAQQVADQRYLVAQDQAALRIDQSNIDTAKLDLDYCHISAPVAGKVGLRLVDPGNYVTSGSSTGIVVITKMRPISVVFSVLQTELQPVLARLRAGAELPAAAYSSDDAKKIAVGRLTAVDNQVDTSTGTVKLRATFANANEALFPNEFVNIHLLVNTLKNATLVPSPAVQTGTPGRYVYLVKANDTVAVRKVSVGPSNGTDTVITGGLKPGDTVVTDGVDRLSDGAKISVAGQASRHAAATGNRKWQRRKPVAE